VTSVLFKCWKRASFKNWPNFKSWYVTYQIPKKNLNPKNLKKIQIQKNFKSWYVTYQIPKKKSKSKKFKKKSKSKKILKVGM
jgi:hypothetical protein